MMRRVCLILVFLFSLMVSFADVKVTLKSGETLSGGIVFQNDEILILKTTNGQRFQYPMSEVRQIEDEIENKVAEQSLVGIENKRKVGIEMHLSGGAGLIPTYSAGGNMSAEIFIGAKNILDRQIFIGGGIGYEAFFITNRNRQELDTYSFIPLQIRISVPFMQTDHAPAAGVSIGYGFSPNSINDGGLVASFDLGWRYQVSQKMAVFAGLTTAVQQGRISYTETIDDQKFSSSPIYSLWKIGAKVAIQF